MKPLAKLYGAAEGPCGIPMRDGVATAVETIIKGLNGDCKSYVEEHHATDPTTGADLFVVRRAKAPASMDFDEGERADISLITSDAVDREKEVMLPEGADWSQARAAGFPATWCHDYYSMPMGRGLWVKRVKEGAVNGWLAKTATHPRPDDLPETSEWWPDIVWHLVHGDGKTSWLPGKSIGFIPTEMRKPTPKDIKARPELADCDTIISKWVALEWAYCTIQCNPDALVQATAKFKALPERFTKSFGVELPATTPTLEDIVAASKAEPPPAPPASAKRQAPTAPLPVCTVPEVHAKVQAEIAAVSKSIPAMIENSLNALRGRV